MKKPKTLPAMGNLLGRASWSLVDQGVVSLGNLLINLQLAWLLPVQEYGVFALLQSGMLALQVITASLFGYPLSVRLATAHGDNHAKLLSLTLVLIVASSLILALFVVAGLAIFGRPELVIPAISYFLLWQLQEAARRGLLADMRHRIATVGDGVTYFGQPLLLAVFTGSGSLDLARALYLMAAACAVGAMIHVTRLRLTAPVLREASSVIANFWLIGKWQLTMSSILLMNMRIYPWALAYAKGAAAAAAFQAVLNIANLMNPLIIGLGNAVPQVAAQKQSQEGIARAWQVSRAYILVGLLPTLAFCGTLLAAPHFVLALFYGANSPYLETALAVQIVALSWPARYIGDLTCCFLIGVEAGHLAVMAYLAGLTASLLVMPFALPFGLSGIAVTIVIAGFVQWASSYWAVTLTGATTTQGLLKTSRPA